MKDWDAYEKKCDEIIKKNEKYIAVFEEDLKGLSPKTIRRHIKYVDLFINEFLLREEPGEIETGPDRIYDYLGWHCIHTFVCISGDSLKQNGTSLKKFYKSMYEHGYVTEDVYVEMENSIVSNIRDWAEECDDYNE